MIPSIKEEGEKNKGRRRGLRDVTEVLSSWRMKAFYEGDH